MYCNVFCHLFLVYYFLFIAFCCHYSLDYDSCSLVMFVYAIFFLKKINSAHLRCIVKVEAFLGPLQQLAIQQTPASVPLWGAQRSLCNPFQCLAMYISLPDPLAKRLPIGQT